MVWFDLFEQFLVLFQKLFWFWFFQKNNTGWFFSFSSNTEFESASDEDVRDSEIFTEDGDVADDINRWDIGSDDTESSGAFFDGLDNILDSSFEFFILIEMSNKLEEFGPHGVIGQWVGDGWKIELLLFGLHLMKIIKFIIIFDCWILIPWSCSNFIMVKVKWHWYVYVMIEILGFVVKVWFLKLYSINLIGRLRFHPAFLSLMLGSFPCRIMKDRNLLRSRSWSSCIWQGNCSSGQRGRRMSRRWIRPLRPLYRFLDTSLLNGPPLRWLLKTLSFLLSLPTPHHLSFELLKCKYSQAILYQQGQQLALLLPWYD